MLMSASNILATTQPIAKTTWEATFAGARATWWEMPTASKETWDVTIPTSVTMEMQTVLQLQPALTSREPLTAETCVKIQLLVALMPTAARSTTGLCALASLVTLAIPRFVVSLWSAHTTRNVAALTSALGTSVLTPVRATQSVA